MHSEPSISWRTILGSGLLHIQTCIFTYIIFNRMLVLKKNFKNYLFPHYYLADEETEILQMYWQIIFWDSWDLRLSAFLLALGNLLCSLLCRLFSPWQSLSSGVAWVSLDSLPFPLYMFFADDFSPSLPSIAAHSVSLWWCLIKLSPAQGMCVGWVQALLEG